MTDSDRVAARKALETLTRLLRVWSPETCTHPHRELNTATGIRTCLECNVRTA